MSAEELKQKLVKESGLVLSQHNPPLWSPKKNINTPSLWVAAANDAVITVKGAKKPAEFYGSDYLEIPNSAHNLMMENSHKDTANKLHQWLMSKTST
jgi:alpha-beta hydrolase superfamily lysophospholipase